MKILSISDVHWGITRASRKDNIHKILYESMEFILDFYRKNEGNLICINGDLFHSHNCSIKKTNELIDLFKKYNIEPEELSIIAGNHCLYKNTFELLDHSSLSIFYKVFPEIEHNEIAKWNFGQNVEDIPKDKKYVQIHQYIDEHNYFEYFKLFPNSKFLLTGDHHKCQIYKNGSQTLLNSGHIVRNSRVEGTPHFFFIENDEYKKIKLLDTNKDIFVDNKRELDLIFKLDISSDEIITLEKNKDSGELYLEYMKKQLTDNEYQELLTIYSKE